MTENRAFGATDYLAAERTFLAWIRTGIALMGFGFVVARFSLYLQALQIGQPDLVARTPGLSPWFGTALIFLGVLVNIWAAANHLRMVRRMKEGEVEFSRASPLTLALTAVLSALGLSMAVYLLSIRPNQ